MKFKIHRKKNAILKNKPSAHNNTIALLVFFKKRIILSLTFIFFFVTLFGSLGCKDYSSKINKLEENLELTTLIAYQLMIDNQKIKQQLQGLVAQNSGLTTQMTEVKSKAENVSKRVQNVAQPPIETSKRKLFIMKMKLMNYQLKNDKYPENIQELKDVLGAIPLEDRSKSNVIHLRKNGQGGWIYDPDEGTLFINSYNH